MTMPLLQMPLKENRENQYQNHYFFCGNVYFARFGVRVSVRFTLRVFILF